MSTTVINALHKLTRLWVSSETPESASLPMEVHLVDKHDIFYKKGRLLAEDAYRKTWNTEHLIDGNNYAVVVSHMGKVLGNMNLQLRAEEKLLKSEKFFGQEHWSGYFRPSMTSVAELSALAVAPDLPSELSRPVMMMLILGMQSLGRLKNISLVVTVQHEFLIRVLQQGLHLPFLCNEQVKTPQGELPNDDYWNQKKSPRLYYLEPNSHQVVETCFSFFCYLNTSGISTVFYPRIHQEKLTYSAFRKSWQSQQPKLELAI